MMEKKKIFRKYTRKELETLFYYYKWGLLAGILILAMVVSMVWQGVSRTKPDYQLGCVTASSLPEDTLTAIKTVLESLGEDLNGDGQVVVEIHAYPVLSESTEGENVQIRVANQALLMADLMGCDSYFFLVDDPDEFQSQYQALALPDGSPAEEDDTDGMSKVYRWADCPSLAGAELGGYEISILDQTITGDNRELVENLYLGRRCFANGKEAQYQAGCNALWEKLIADAS